MDVERIISMIAVYAIPVIFAITIHEAAHGYVARYFGDNTAWMLGRVTLNPIKHIDPVGTILVPILTSFGGFLFGWAKPVPVNFENLRNPKRDMLWVAAAGPGVNLVMALMWAVLVKVLISVGGSGAAFEFWLRVGVVGIQINVVLAVLNLFPLLPLDGGRMLVSILPDKLAYAYSRLEPYGMFILIILVVSPVLGWILGPIVGSVLQGIDTLIGF